MRFLTFLLCAAAVFLPAQSPGASQTDALRRQLERSRELVSAGALAPSKLKDLEEALLDAEDQGVLQDTLYRSLTLEELNEGQSESMVNAARRRLDRQADRLGRLKDLAAAGAVASNQIAEAAQELASRQETLDQAVRRAGLFEQLLAAARVETEPDTAPAVEWKPYERFEGRGVFTPGDWRRLSGAFQQEFGRALPVSANGSTAVHRALGYDHRGRVDLALAPDDPEGVWVRRWLTQKGVPFFAFRVAIRGSATAPHIHVGPPSLRNKAVD
ncbi:MAG: hypothetical protein K2X35_18815 [Bryobacteraceae bacterium]|nr:hypothetical protein [Bryobacteraceae bacterium]